MSAPEPARKSFGSVLTGALVGFTLVAGALLGWSRIEGSNATSAAVFIVLWFNTVVLAAMVGVEVSRRPYSLHLMHLTSLYLFMGAAALFQYTTGTFPMAGPIASLVDQVPSASLAITLWIVVYLAVYEADRRFGRAPKRGVRRFLSRPLVMSRAVVLSGLSLIAIAYLAAIGLSGVSARGVAEETLRTYAVDAAGGAGLGQAFYLVNHFLLRALPLVALTALILAHRDAAKSAQLGLVTLLALLAVGNFIANNPFAASRMWLVTAILGLLLPLVCLRFRTGWVVVAVSLGGLMILPALNESRTALNAGQVFDFFFLASPFDYLARSADVDALGMLSLCVKWTEENGYRLGLQSLGAVLFFVPRLFWPTKPIGTGAMVTRDFGWSFTNLSPPIVAEGFVDLGFVGVAILAAIFAWLFSRADKTYYEDGNPRNRPRRVVDVIYPFWMTCVVFLTRGDMISAVTHTAAFTAWIFPLAFAMTGAVLPQARTGPARAR